MMSSCCAQPLARPDLDAALLVERHHAEWFVAEGSVAGTEVHTDPDVTWLVHPGEAWRNSAIMVRLSPSTASRRLDMLVSRYRKHGRGMALWVSPAATPDNLTELLKGKGLRCRQHFPAMLRYLSASTRPRKGPAGLEIRRVKNVEEFERVRHPAIGPLTTPLRRAALQRLATLIGSRHRRSVMFVAWRGWSSSRIKRVVSWFRMRRAAFADRSGAASPPRHRYRARRAHMHRSGSARSVSNGAPGVNRRAPAVRTLRIFGSRQIRILVSELSAMLTQDGRI